MRLRKRARHGVFIGENAHECRGPALQPEEKRSSTWPREPLAWLAAGCGAWLLLELLPPASVVCPLRATTGLLCPGCGGTEAIRALLHGHLDAALHANALVTLALAPAAWLGARAFWLASQARRPLPALPQSILAALLALVLAFTVWRNWTSV